MDFLCVSQVQHLAVFVVSRLILKHLGPETARVLPKFPLSSLFFTKFTLSSELALLSLLAFYPLLLGDLPGNHPNHTKTFISRMLNLYDSDSRFPVSFLFLSQREKSHACWASSTTESHPEPQREI